MKSTWRFVNGVGKTLAESDIAGVILCTTLGFLLQIQKTLHYLQ